MLPPILLSSLITRFSWQMSVIRIVTSLGTLMDIFQTSKRLKISSFVPSSQRTLLLPELTAAPALFTTQATGNSDGKFTEDLTLNPSSTGITKKQQWRIEFNKGLTKSRRNHRICSDVVAEAKAEGLPFVMLEKLLIEETWLEALPKELQKPYAKNLFKFIEREACGKIMPIYPPSHLIFNALNTTPFDSVKAIIIGQDPYHGTGQAMGLAFSVPEGVKIPSSLVNIFKELKNDIGCSIPSHGNLEKWAVQGVLLLNTVLTVRSASANSHAKKGWEQFTDAVITTLSARKKGLVFLLWGNHAQQKEKLIDGKKHHVLKAAHPSGLSASRGFFGCKHFSLTNKILEEMGFASIDWQI